ncbi:MAG: hypothetical protein BWX96_01936 [Bacteroidetes bacterium ADurb.Bin145]|nr:MAG: hypothetical protein BWX96_01936 [Bacteroidetes bacterium ADurb.Bin145]
MIYTKYEKSAVSKRKAVMRHKISKRMPEIFVYFGDFSYIYTI